MNATDYGFIGIGRMGANMAKRLLDAGFSLTVYDTSRAAVDTLVGHGAQAASSAAEVADTTETVFLSLPTPDIIHRVALGERGVHEGSRVRQVFDCSTTGPEMARIVAAELAKKSIAYLDSPVSGGIAGAKNGTLAVMVSGPRAIFERAEPALRQFGKLFHVGEEPGQGQIMKLANNLLAAAAIVLSSEAIAMGVKAGLDAKQMVEIINAGTGRNSATQDKFPRAVLTRTFDFGFATGLSYKDVKLCVHEAENLGVPMVAGSAVLQMLAITQARFGADSDFTSIARVVEEWAGVEIKPKA
ncbi:MAG TPA: NAD(P)-dependent oxidoreductase [Gammaproteobacteria bacterium]